MTINGTTFTNLGSITGPGAVTSGGVILPVELAEWKGKYLPTHQHIFLEWTTTTEINNKGFFVEKSTDGKHFEQIAWIDGHGDSKELNHYSYEDKKVYSVITYYRLLQIDYEGTSEYSKIISISEKNLPFHVELKANYVDEYLYIESTKELQYDILDLTGKICKTGTLGAIANQISISDIPSGTYFILLKDNLNQSKIFQFLKFN